MQLNTIRFKIRILYTTILAIILAVYATILHYDLLHTTNRAINEELRTKAQSAIGAIISYLDLFGYSEETLKLSAKKIMNPQSENLVPKLMSAKTADPASMVENAKLKTLESLWTKYFYALNLEKDNVILFDDAGKEIVSSSKLGPDFMQFPFAAKKDIPEGPIFKNITYKNEPFRVITAGFWYRNEGHFVLRIATPVGSVAKFLKERFYASIIPIPIFLFLGFFIGQIFTSRILKPVIEITRTAKSITYVDLRARVNDEKIDEEMKYLVSAFNEMISRLEKSFKYIEEFSSRVAHELKTPIAIIRGESELALAHEPQTEEEYRYAIRTVLEESERLLRIIEDLLLLAKLDYRPDIFKFKKFDLNRFLWNIFLQAKSLAAEKGVDVSANIPREKLFVMADNLHLRRLFFNLINNAIKFTSEKGKIVISAKKEGNKVLVSITDTGIGIKESEIPKIFEKFSHISQSGFEEERGVGLGLNIALSIAKVHQGDIQVKSKEGEGTTFVVTLPLTS